MVVLFTPLIFVAQFIVAAACRRQELPVLSRWVPADKYEAHTAKMLDVILYRSAAQLAKTKTATQKKIKASARDRE